MLPRFCAPRSSGVKGNQVGAAPATAPGWSISGRHIPWRGRKQPPARPPGCRCVSMATPLQCDRRYLTSEAWNQARGFWLENQLRSQGQSEEEQQENRHFHLGRLLQFPPCPPPPAHRAPAGRRAMPRFVAVQATVRRIVIQAPRGERRKYRRPRLALNRRPRPRPGCSSCTQDRTAAQGRHSRSQSFHRRTVARRFPGYFRFR